MDARITRLLEAFEQVAKPVPQDLLAFLRELPDVGTLPSPWETWALIGLVRHRDRQYWVRDIVQNRLKGDAAKIGARGAFGHPQDMAQSGSVPGMPEWEYYFHGRGCCLTHKVTGEEIDVDFWDETAEYFDLFFYKNYLESLRNPEPPEQRLLELHRSVRPVVIAIKSLRTSAAMVPIEGRETHPLRIAEAVLASSDAVEDFCQGWSDPTNKIWLAALIGDWLAAHEAATGQPELQRITGPRAKQCLAIRRELLRQQSGYDASDALFGLIEIDAADNELKAAFSGPPSGLISAALEIVSQQGDSKWCPDVYAMFTRMNPSGDIPEPHLWMNALKLLLQHGYCKDELITALPKSGNAEMGEGVLLALEYAPEHALGLIRKALLSRIPCNRTTVAATLALINNPWSLRELFRALENSDDQEHTADARAALLETGSPEAERVVVAWQERNPHEPEPGEYVEIDGRIHGPLFSMAEHILNGRASRMRYEMDKLHDRVMKIKDVIPPEPLAKPWWKFWNASQ